MALRGPLDLIIVVLVIAAFGAVAILQNAMPRVAHRPFWQGFYVHLTNGFYANTLANRLILRLWPSPPPASGAQP